MCLKLSLPNGVIYFNKENLIFYFEGSGMDGNLGTYGLFPVLDGLSLVDPEVKFGVRFTQAIQDLFDGEKSHRAALP